MPAYGFKFPDLDFLNAMKAVNVDDWPSVNIEFVDKKFLNHSNLINLEVGLLNIEDINQLKLKIYLEKQISIKEFIHPHIQFALPSLAQINQDFLFHSGAVIINGKLFGILGDRGAGKSSLLFEMFKNFNLEIFTDDVMLIRKNMVCIGPRLIGLRQSASEKFLKKQISLIEIPPMLYSEIPIAGWFIIGWSDNLFLKSLSVKELSYELQRYDLLKKQRFVQINFEYYKYLSLFPAWKIFRPKKWAYNTDIINCMLKIVNKDFN
ncbi:hypothetical protein HZC33_03360 [Candidatus Wolfebacteria bacterium]|nr:hypothetical protein [Candidatus Wolfebacteria bacterium]